MFKPETLEKYSNAAKKALQDSKTKILMSDAKITISRGNDKIGKVLNVSLLPILTCANCKECKKLCYDIKACLQYPKNVLQARANNTAMAIYDSEKYFAQIRKALKYRRKNKFFRWHVGGDIPNFDYFCNMVEIAREFPDFIFWTYTKNYKIVNLYCDKYGKENIPKNFSVMFSEWRGIPMINPYKFPEFRVVFKTDENKPDPKKNFYCKGNCAVCLKKKTGCPYRKDVFCNEH